MRCRRDWASGSSQCPNCGGASREDFETELLATDGGDPTCDVSECSSTEALRECLDPEDNRIRACADCRSDWPRQLRVVEVEP